MATRDHLGRCGLALLALGIGALAPPVVRAQLLTPSAALAEAPVEVVNRLRSDPFAYFRFMNRIWTDRVCRAFANEPDVPVVRLHGDAHVEQFALTDAAWGLEDFDDSTRGPAVVDIVRFLGSIDLATRRRAWTRDRDALWDRFLAGYRQGLTDPDYRPPEPEIVQRLRAQTPVTRASFLAWGERLMRRMNATTRASVDAGMAALEQAIRQQRSDLRPGYFTVVRAGWLQMGVGSAAIRKVLIRVQGPSADPDDDELIEAKEVAPLVGAACLESSPTQPARRIIEGTRQLGRLRHNIRVVGPTLLIPATPERPEHRLEWWASSWEPSYREVQLSDLRSVQDLGDIVYDAGVQLGSGTLPSSRARALSSTERLEGRLRAETAAIVEELLAGWRELSRR